MMVCWGTSQVPEPDGSTVEGEGLGPFNGSPTAPAVKLALRGGVEVIDLGRGTSPASPGVRLGYKSVKKYRDKQFLQSITGSSFSPSFTVSTSL